VTPIETPLQTSTQARGGIATAPNRNVARSEVTQSQPAATAQGALLRGRVVDDLLGTPLAGARVTVAYRLHAEFSNLDLEHNRSSRPVGELTTDSEGTFEASVPQAVPLDVEVSARAHATARRSHLFAGDDVELRLAPAAILDGLLTRASDGAPVEGALVRGWNSNRVEQFRARTGPGGTFLFDDLQAGLITVAITPRDVSAPPWKKVDLHAGTRTRLDLVLESGVRVHGIVNDPEGRPIAGAEIGEGWTFRKSVFSDALGHYELSGFGGPGVYDIHARAVGYGGERHGYPHEAMPTEDTRLDFVLESARSAIGRVLTSEGTPLEDVYVAGVASQQIGGTQRSDWESSLTGADGRFELTSLHGALEHQLFLRKEGFGTRVYDFPADEAQRGRVDLGDFVLLPGAVVEGTLRTLTGVPIPDHTVKLRGSNADIDRLRPDTEATNATWYTTVRQSRTDTRGRFHFADVPGGEFKATASVRGKPSLAASASIEVPEGGRLDAVELALDFGAPITGVVIKPDGSPAIGVFVHVLKGDPQGRVNATSGAGGRFEVLGVSGEMGDVMLVTGLSSYNWGNPKARLGASPPVVARAGDTNITLRLRALVVLTGRVEDAAGGPVAGTFVSAFPSGLNPTLGPQLASVLTDEAGRFRMELPSGSHVDLEAGRLQRKQDSDEFVLHVDTEPARLEFVASDGRDVVMRLAD
jgi:hypothetical protein